MWLKSSEAQCRWGTAGHTRCLHQRRCQVAQLLSTACNKVVQPESGACPAAVRAQLNCKLLASGGSPAPLLPTVSPWAPAQKGRPASAVPGPMRTSRRPRRWQSPPWMAAHRPGAMRNCGTPPRLPAGGVCTWRWAGKKNAGQSPRTRGARRPLAGGCCSQCRGGQRQDIRRYKGARMGARCSPCRSAAAAASPPASRVAER
jgi:hypothetical protein